ncbi:MAG: septum formation initiator family protein [Gemmatimonadales bacterium]
MSRTRQVGAAVIGLAILYALIGGEYSISDWLTLRSQERVEQATIADLTVAVDSLRRFAMQLETNPKLQERIAREEFGMVRSGEFLYRLGRDSLDEQ